MNSATNIASKRLRSPASASSASASLDLLVRTRQELFRELDHYFSEPTVARRALVAVKAAREGLGENGLAASGEQLNRTKQAFRCYQQAMNIILAGYLERYGTKFPADMLTLAARGAQGQGNDAGGGQSGACTTAAYVLASESFESFVELMRRVDASTPPHGNGRAHPNRDIDPFGEAGTPAQPPPTDWGFSSMGPPDRPSSRLTGDPARKGIALFTNTSRGAAPPPETSGLSLSQRHSRGGPGGPGDAVSARLGPPTPPTPPQSIKTAGSATDPAGAAASSSFPSWRDEVAPAAPSSCCHNDGADVGGRLANDCRRGREIDAATPGQEEPGGTEGGGGGGGGINRLHEHGAKALSCRTPTAPALPAMERPAAGGTAVDHSAAESNRSPFQQDRGAFDGHWLHARGWFVETGSSDWVSVLAASTAAGGEIGGAGGDQMDMSSTFGTDIAVASPRRLLDESESDLAFGSSLEDGNISSLFASRDCAPSFRFSSSSRRDVKPYGCTPYGGFDDGDGDDDDDDDDFDDDESCAGSEEFFPEPDPFDPADGGLPCLSRCPRDAWALAGSGTYSKGAMSTTTATTTAGAVTTTTTPHK